MGLVGFRTGLNFHFRAVSGQWPHRRFTIVQLYQIYVGESTDEILASTEEQITFFRGVSFGNLLFAFYNPHK